MPAQALRIRLFPIPADCLEQPIIANNDSGHLSRYVCTHDMLVEQRLAVRVRDQVTSGPSRHLVVSASLTRASDVVSMATIYRRELSGLSAEEAG